MFRSLACGASSIASVPLSKSSAASSYASSYGKKIGKDLNDKELNLKIKYLRRYEISCLEDGSDQQGLAEFGIGVLNFFGAFTKTKIDYPDHWFLIAETELNLDDEYKNNHDEIRALFHKNPELREVINKLEKENTYYYLIEKGENGKRVTYYKSIDDILKEEKSNYHYNTIYCKETYELKKNITIKDIIDYVEILSDEYNLIDDNCQVFVRNILNHFDII